MNNPGRADVPVPLKDRNSVIVRHPQCPDCNGRGWFLINPFATGGSNGTGGVGNLTQCLTCQAAHDHWQAHGELPPEFVNRIQQGAAT